nr:protein argonaute 18 [Quercus suber]
MSGRGRGRGSYGANPEHQNMPHRPRGGAEGAAGRGDRGGRGGRGGYDSSRGNRGGSGPYRGGRGGGAPNVPITTFTPEYRPEKDAILTQREDTLLKQAGKDSAVILPRRPAYGKQGPELLVWTNYFRLQMSDLTVFRYAVKVTRNSKEASKALAKRVIQLLIEDHLKDMKIDAVSDFRSTLITRQRLDGDLKFDVVYRAELETEPEDDAPQFQVALEHTGTLNMSELVNSTTSTSVGTSLSQSQELLQALNIIIGHASRTDPNTVTSGRNTRVSTAADQPRISLQGGLDALRAFVFSARAATERVLVNVQVKNLPFIISGPLTDLVVAFRNAGGARSALSLFLRLVSVQVTHIQRRGKSGNVVPRYKTIISLARRGDGRGLPHPPKVPEDGAGAKKVEFWLEEPKPAAEGSSKKKGKQKATAGGGRYISVFDFFRTRYNITIHDPDLPVVNVGTTVDPSYLPLQVCNVRPGQVAKGKISPQQTANMIKFAVRQPSANAESITTVGLNLLRLERSDLPAFSMSIRPQLLAVPGRRLPSPKISFAGQKTVSVMDARWDLRDKQLLRGATMQDWACLYIPGPSRVWSTPEALQECLASFRATLRSIGIQCAAAPVPTLQQNSSPAAISDGIRKLVSGSKKPGILLVIVPANNNSGIYNAVKYICDVQEGVLCQCVVDTKFAKEQKQYFANVGLKINLKLGGANHSIPVSSFGAISPEKTMFVGLDVTHPSPGSTSSAPSVASIVSSIDSTLAQWPAAIRVQEARKEMITDLTELVEGQLKLWQAKHRTLPVNIILYRDGVSEGQYQVVLDVELPSIKQAINNVYSPTQVKQGLPALSIIVVGKRHHTRFYPTKEADADKTGNPKHGLVVDRGVTNFANWDFFLQAHTALHGTAKPAHYYVIYDEVIRKSAPGQTSAADVLENMTHGLCYLFGRATTAVSICPPAYYADLVCERARCYLSEQFAPSGTATPTSESSGGTGVKVSHDLDMMELDRLRLRVPAKPLASFCHSCMFAGIMYRAAPVWGSREVFSTTTTMAERILILTLVVLSKFKLQRNELLTSVYWQSLSLALLVLSRPASMADDHFSTRTRAYQREMFERSMEGNRIIVMDTGSGKTQVAMLRIQAELDRCGTEKRIWFLAPSVDLCVQQHNVLQQAMPAYKMRLLTGEDNVDKWSDLKIWTAALDQARVVVSTHEILKDALSHAFVNLTSLALLVFDEGKASSRYWDTVVTLSQRIIALKIIQRMSS